MNPPSYTLIYLQPSWEFVEIAREEFEIRARALLSLGEGGAAVSHVGRVRSDSRGDSPRFSSFRGKHERAQGKVLCRGEVFRDFPADRWKAPRNCRGGTTHCTTLYIALVRLIDLRVIPFAAMIYRQLSLRTLTSFDRRVWPLPLWTLYGIVEVVSPTPGFFLEHISEFRMRIGIHIWYSRWYLSKK